jgi:hypothetical protein
MQMDLRRKILPLFLFISTSLHAADAPKPKYGPQAEVLSHDHSYLEKNAAPDFWALMPFYVSQQDGSSCSVATLSAIVNGARSDRKLTADDELVTQSSLTKKVRNTAWHKLVGGYGVTLDQLGAITREALEAYGVKVTSVEVVHAENTPEAKAKLHEALVENEKSNHDFILLNFNQKLYTGDAEVGHVAALGAYDAAKKRALVLDPDREWYEPYWVSEDVLNDGMATLDKSAGKNRGYVWVKFER